MMTQRGKLGRSIAQTLGRTWWAAGTVQAALLLATVLVTAAVGPACGSAEPRVVEVTVRVHPAVPCFDFLTIGISGLRRGYNIQDGAFRVSASELASDSSYDFYAYASPGAEILVVQVEARDGSSVVGHCRRSVAVFEARDYYLELTVEPTTPHQL